MHLTANEIIDVPIGAVWTDITRLDIYEAALRKRNVTLTRHDVGGPENTQAGEGTSWTAEFALAGRKMKATAEIARMDPPKALHFEGGGAGLQGFVRVALTEIDEGTTELDLSVGLEASALGAQVLLQPLKLARGKLQHQLDDQLHSIARAIEARYDS